MLFQLTDATQHSEESVSASAVHFLIFLQPFSGPTEKVHLQPISKSEYTMKANAGVPAHPHLIFN